MVEIAGQVAPGLLHKAFDRSDTAPAEGLGRSLPEQLLKLSHLWLAVATEFLIHQVKFGLFLVESESIETSMQGARINLIPHVPQRHGLSSHRPMIILRVSPSLHHLRQFEQSHVFLERSATLELAECDSLESRIRVLSRQDVFSQGRLHGDIVVFPGVEGPLDPV